MRSLQGETTAYVNAPPARVFGVITDLERLPEWNERIVGVSERPAALEPGAEWVVKVRLAGQTFSSRSVLRELDRDRRRFSYRSKRDDRNPSYTEWTWTVDEEDGGSRVTLAWDLQPLTFLRRRVVAPMRARHFEGGETAASLAALEAVCVESAP